MIRKYLLLQWIVVLVVSLNVLILRVIDFADEAVQQKFHITRAGLDVIGPNAFFIQITIIFLSFLLAKKASENLLKYRLGFVTK